MKKQVIKEGTYEIEYRAPDLIETMEMIGGLGINPENPDAGNEYKLMAKMIRESENFVISIKKSGKLVTWSEALQDRSGFSTAAGLLASKIMIELEDSEVKKTRKKSSSK